MLNINYWVEHWFNPSPVGEGTGTQCRDCYGWRDDPRHRYGDQPNLNAYAVLDAPGVGPRTVTGKRRQGPKARTRPTDQLETPAPAGPLAALVLDRAWQVLTEALDQLASLQSPEAPQEGEGVALTSEGLQHASASASSEAL